MKSRRSQRGQSALPVALAGIAKLASWQAIRTKISSLLSLMFGMSPFGDTATVMPECARRHPRAWPHGKPASQKPGQLPVGVHSAPIRRVGDRDPTVRAASCDAPGPKMPHGHESLVEKRCPGLAMCWPRAQEGAFSDRVPLLPPLPLLPLPLLPPLPPLPPLPSLLPTFP